MNRYPSGHGDEYPEPHMDNQVIDMHGKTIKIGSMVRLYGTLNNMLKENPFKQGKVTSLGPAPGYRAEALVWIDGQACHHPLACEVYFEET